MVGTPLRAATEKHQSGANASTGPGLGKWLALVTALALVEAFLTSLLFSFPTNLPEWSNPIAYAKKSAHLGIFAVLAFAVIVWPARGRIIELWNETSRHRDRRPSVAANLVLFAALLLGAAAFSKAASGQPPPPAWFAAYCALLVATGASLACLAAPAAFWRGLFKLAQTEIALALLSACFVLLASELSKESWSTLSAATLSLSHWILTLYETNVSVDFGRNLLGVGDFHVLILRECSGYEGAGLVVGFLALYTWIFRRDLLFPNMLVLFPIGVAAVWLLNAVRIAALVSIGAHVSPAMAVEGFHSQAGWIGFLLVAIGTMLLSQRSRFFSAGLHRERRRSAPADQRLAAGLLAPFMALMAAGIVAAAFTPHDRWLYALKVAAVGAALWWYRSTYVGLIERVSPLSILAGVGVGLAWVMTDPLAGNDTSLGPWLASLPASVAATWIGLRALGAIVLVPVAEELAFRGYLHRALIARQFERVAFGQFGWLAFVGSSILFGLLHQRWIAGALAGAVFALVMYRTNRLSDPIAAHMAANAVIAIWAVAFAQWSLF